MKTRDVLFQTESDFSSSLLSTGTRTCSQSRLRIRSRLCCSEQSIARSRLDNRERPIELQVVTSLIPLKPIDSFMCHPRTVHDIKKKVFIRDVSLAKKVQKFPDDTVFGTPCRYAEPFFDWFHWSNDLDHRRLWPNFYSIAFSINGWNHSRTNKPLWRKNEQKQR